MTITATRLTQAAGACAALAGGIFVGVNINHPHVDLASITTTELVIRNSLKLLMCALALAGIAGMYLSQVRRNGVLGLLGYLVLGLGCSLWSTARRDVPTQPAEVGDRRATTTGGEATV